MTTHPERLPEAAIDRLGPCREPPGPHEGTQRWDRLLFSHWEVPAALLRERVHPALTLDTWEGRCFVGVVAFGMQNVRPWRRLPGVPLARDFREVNVRTYVHFRGAEPGVWFLSLDADNALAAWAARTFWHLPYLHASVSGGDDGARGSWSVRRSGERPVQWSARFEIGEALGHAQPGTLEFFLTERYQLYAARGGALLRGRVHHTPYPLHRATTSEMGGGLLEALGLPSTGARTPDYFSPGVDTRMYPLEEVR